MSELIEQEYPETGLTVQQYRRKLKEEIQTDIENLIDSDFETILDYKKLQMRIKIQKELLDNLTRLEQ